MPEEPTGWTPLIASNAVSGLIGRDISSIESDKSLPSDTRNSGGGGRSLRAKQRIENLIDFRQNKQKHKILNMAQIKSGN